MNQPESEIRENENEIVTSILEDSDNSESCDLAYCPGCQEIDNYMCSICQDILYRPVTLICQHTFCYLCLEEYYNSDGLIDDSTFSEIRYQSQKKNKCPLCNIPYTLPPMENIMLTTLIEEKFPEEYHERKDYFENEKAMEKKKQETEQTMRREIWNMLSTDFDTNNPPICNGNILGKL